MRPHSRSYETLNKYLLNKYMNINPRTLGSRSCLQAVQLPHTLRAFTSHFSPHRGLCSVVPPCPPRGEPLLASPPWLLGPYLLFPCLGLEKLPFFVNSTVCFLYIHEARCAFYYYFFYWSIVDLQCRVSFCCTAEWLSFTDTYVPFFMFFSIMVYPRRLDIVPCAVQ